MKIVIFSTYFTPYDIGGAEIACYEFVTYLISTGHKVKVITGDHERAFGAKGRKDELPGCSVVRIPMARPYNPHTINASHSMFQRTVWHLKDHTSKKAVEQIKNEIQDFSPSLINVHNHQGFTSDLFTALQIVDIPTLFTLHDYNLVCINNKMTRKNTECKSQCLSCYASSKFKFYGLRNLSNFGIWSPSNYLLRTVKKYLPRQPNLSLQSFYPLSFPNSRKFEDTCSNSKDHKLRILFVGQIVDHKGIAFLLEILTSFDPGLFTLTIVGDGPLLDTLKRQYSQYSAFNFTGRLSQNQISDILINSTDIQVVPSIWHDNSPLVIYHALSLGIPVIGSNAGGISDLVSHNVNGLLIPMNDSKSWSRELRRLINDRTVLIKIKDGANKNRRLFSKDTCGSRVMRYVTEWLQPFQNS